MSVRERVWAYKRQERVCVHVRVRACVNGCEYSGVGKQPLLPKVVFTVMIGVDCVACLSGIIEGLHGPILLPVLQAHCEGLHRHTRAQVQSGWWRGVSPEAKVFLIAHRAQFALLASRMCIAPLLCPSTCIQVIAFASVFDVAVAADTKPPQTSAPNPPLALVRPPGRTPHTKRVSLRQVRCL